MFYAWDITIPPNTLEASPTTQILKLSKGVITRADIKFPRGCKGLAKVRLFRYESQLIPFSRDEWITGDDEAIPTEGYYELVETPAQLKFIGINADDTYEHTVSVRIQILPKAVATFMPLIDVMTRFLKRIGVIK